MWSEPVTTSKLKLITSFGLFEFFVCHSVCEMQLRCFSTLLTNGLQFCYAYIDDQHIGYSSPEKQKQYLLLVLKHLKKNGVLIHPAKCVFAVKQLEFLGHHVDSQGIQPLKDKVGVLQETPQPTT